MQMDYNNILNYIIKGFVGMDNEIQKAIDKMAREKLPINQASYKLYNIINDAICEYANDNGFDETEIFEYLERVTDNEEMFWDALKMMMFEITPKYPKSLHEAFFNKHIRNVYDDGKDPDKYETQPLRNNISLYDIRQRVEQIIKNCNSEDVAIAKKQAMRLYKFIDAAINQGFYLG